MTQQSDTNSPRTVALHIGAHKTATTHLQRSLNKARASLAAYGASFYGPEQLRGPRQTLIDRFGLDVDGARAQNKSSLTRAEQMDAMLGDARRLILSDENFIGTLQTKAGVMPVPLYPRAPERVAALAHATGLPQIDIFLGVRDPASFLTSAYSQLLMAGDGLAFDHYLTKNPIVNVYWPGLVARLVALPCVGRVVVWRQEDYTTVFPQICAELIGTPMPIRPLAGVAHRGLSAQAVEAALETFARTGARGAGKTARETFPINQIYPQFAPFDAGTLAASTTEYAAQLSDIAALDGVTLLRP